MKPSASCAETKPAVIETVPLTRVALSGSLTVSVPVIGVAAAFSVYDSAAPSIAANTGGSLTGETVTLRDCVLLTLVPSLTWKVTVRVLTFGLSLVSV